MAEERRYLHVADAVGDRAFDEAAEPLVVEAFEQVGDEAAGASANPRFFALGSLEEASGRTGQVDEALRRMDALAVRKGEGSEIPKLRWSARGYAAELRCERDQRERGRRDLDALLAELRTAQPDGGVIPREIARIRARCI